MLVGRRWWICSECFLTGPSRLVFIRTWYIYCLCLVLCDMYECVSADWQTDKPLACVQPKGWPPDVRHSSHSFYRRTVWSTPVGFSGSFVCRRGRGRFYRLCLNITNISTTLISPVLAPLLLWLTHLCVKNSFWQAVNLNGLKKSQTTWETICYRQTTENLCDFSTRRFVLLFIIVLCSHLLFLSSFMLWSNLMGFFSTRSFQPYYLSSLLI